MRETLLLTTEYPPHKGGVGSFMHQVVECSTFKIINIYTETPKNIQKNDIIKTYSLCAFLWPHWLPLLLKIMLMQKKWDHIIVSSILPLGTIAYIVNKFFKIPYTIFIHGLDLKQIPQGSRKFKLAQNILKSAHTIIANSESTKNITTTFIGKKEISILHPRAHITPETTNQMKPKLFPSRFKTKKMFLSVGRLVKRKNTHSLIKAAKQLSYRNDICFIIAGDGPEKEKLQSELAGDASVKILSNLSDGEIAWLHKMSIASIFIPYEETGGDIEGFGIVAIEANAFSKPVIASRSGGVADAVKENVSGVFVDPHNIMEIAKQIELFADQKKETSELGERAHSRYQLEFSKDAFCKTLSSIYEKKILPISIIIPAYNSEKTIKNCILSILKQTYLPIEIIVVNDGSTDTTGNILASFSSTITQMNQENKGAPSARNNGARISKGDFLLFVDADMTLHPDMLKKQFEALQKNSGASFVYSSFKFGWKKFPALPFDPARLTKHNYIHTSSLMKKEVFPGFDESLIRHQDWDLWLTIVRKGHKGVKINDILYTIQLEKNRISKWLPSIIYSLPYSEKIFPEIKRYNTSKQKLIDKHNL